MKLIVLTLTIALVSFFVIGCGGGGGSDGTANQSGETPYYKNIRVWLNTDRIFIWAWKHHHSDGYWEDLTASISGTVNDGDLTYDQFGTNENGYQIPRYFSDPNLTPGDAVTVFISHPDLGDFEMDVIVPDETPLINFSPHIEVWLSNIIADDTNDAMTVYWDQPDIANYFQFTIMENVSLGPWEYESESVITSDFSIQLGNDQNDDGWSALKQALIAAEEGKCYLLTDWRSSKNWGTYSVNAEFRANDLTVIFNILPDIEKAYDVYADYT